ncbi:nucleolar complex protein [Planoprotostelium fungivorum]|uniref:Nucleolar complex protein n=1 Tax=Planoprotostelium fungivorum TaxID=1890364 RepID=A0A2P6MW86_9EUKA|nr:nucleolar complex protein [Planoprotostelium fungivorum]
MGRILEDRLKRQREDSEKTQQQKKKKIEQASDEILELDPGARRNRIAAACSLITRNPQENINSFKILFKFLELSEDLKDDVISLKLVLGSLLAVFIDVLPSYEIRPLTEVEKSAAVTKEVKELREYEAKLVKWYKNYIFVLEKALKDDDLLLTSSKCLCKLLSSTSEFNFHAEVIAIIVPLLNNKNQQIQTLVAEAIIEVFREDRTGEPSVRITRNITDLVKRKGFQVQRIVLEVLLSLQVDQVLGASDLLEPEKKKPSERKITKAREEEALLRKVAEVQDKRSREEFKKRQAEVLKWVFTCYFRVLKQTASSPLLVPVLRGFTKFSHLINMDIVADLLNVLKGLMKRDSKSSLEIKLEATVTAFAVMKHQETLEVDMKQFYTHVYETLPNLCVETCKTSWHQQCRLTLETLDHLLLQVKRVPIDRVTGFLRRLSMLSLYMDADLLVPILYLMHLVLKKYPRATCLVDGEHMGSGVFDHETEDPDNSNAMTSTLVEFNTLLHHHHPMVVAIAREIILQHAEKDEEAKKQFKVTKWSLKARELFGSKVGVKQIFDIHRNGYGQDPFGAARPMTKKKKNKK